MAGQDVVVIDNGGSTLRCARASTSASASGQGIDGVCVPNAIARTRDRRTHVGGAIAALADYSGLHLRRPMDRGVPVDWAAQKAIWDATLPLSALGGGLVLLTQPYGALPDTQDALDTLLFHEYGVAALWRTCAASLVPFAPGLWAAAPTPPARGRKTLSRPEACVVLDCGFSYTHAVPILRDQVQWHAVKRLDLGGKLLTNLLKETLSFRQWDMMDETYLTDKVKERCCFVANAPHVPNPDRASDSPETGSYAYLTELCASSPNPLRQEYCLPDYATVPTDDRGRFGYVREGQGEGVGVGVDVGEPEEQVLVMEGERFQVTEALFQPALIGLDQCGLAELVAAAIHALPQDERDMMWPNIVLVGGTAALPGLRQRLENELRSLAPQDIPLRIWQTDDPASTAFQGGLALATAPPGSPEHAFLRSHLVTRADYLAKPRRP